MENWPESPKFGDQYMDTWAQDWFWDGGTWVSDNARSYTVDPPRKYVPSVTDHLRVKEQERNLSAWERRVLLMVKEG